MTPPDSEGRTTGPSNDEKPSAGKQSVTAGEIDPERLALFLEGKLSEPARSELMARLAASEDYLGAMVDAASIAPEVQEAASPVARTRRRHWFDRPAWYALAAAILIAAIVPASRNVRHKARSDALDFAAILIANGRSPGLDAPFAAWPVTRSADGPVISASARSVRLGARSTDLELAVRNGDARSPALAREMAVLLDAIPGAGPVADIYRNIATRSDSKLDASTLIQKGRRALQQLPGDSLVLLGAWLEGARLAAHQRDAAFFEAPQSRQMVVRVRALSTVPDSARTYIAITTPTDEVEWATRERVLGELLLSLSL